MGFSKSFSHAFWVTIVFVLAVIFVFEPKSETALNCLAWISTFIFFFFFVCGLCTSEDTTEDKLDAEQAARVAAECHAAEEAGKAAVLQERVKELEAALASERTARAAAEQGKAASDATLAAFRKSTSE